MAVFTALAQPVALPAVFHCAAGKDRTGIVALLQRLLSLNSQTVAADYALSDLAPAGRHPSLPGHPMTHRRGHTSHQRLSTWATRPRGLGQGMQRAFRASSQHEHEFFAMSSGWISERVSLRSEVGEVGIVVGSHPHDHAVEEE